MAAPTATDGGTGTTASVAFTAVSGATSYTVISSPGSFTGTGSSSPITVSGLTTGTAYTFQVRATNSVGTGAYSAASNSVTPETPGAWESIASTVVSSSTASITFSSIVSTYSQLQLRIIGKSTYTSTVSDNLKIWFNGNTTTSNYQTTYFSGVSSGNPTSATTTTGVAYVDVGNVMNTDLIGSNYKGSVIIDIPQYANTSKWKAINFFGGNMYSSATVATQAVTFGTGLFRSTSAITSITIGAVNGNISLGTFALYGIK